ncbi:unnamed protein product, partial [Allacma fusca]
MLAQNLQKLFSLRVPSTLLLSRCGSFVVNKSSKYKRNDDQPFFDSDTVEDPSVITVPIRLEKRLKKKVKNEKTKYFQRQRVLHESRKGSK